MSQPDDKNRYEQHVKMEREAQQSAPALLRSAELSGSHPDELVTQRSASSEITKRAAQASPTTDLVGTLRDIARLLPLQYADMAADQIERLQWRLDYIRENRNDQTAISCALDCTDQQADEMRNAR